MNDSKPGPVTGYQKYACSCHAARAERTGALARLARKIRGWRKRAGTGES